MRTAPLAFPHERLKDTRVSLLAAVQQMLGCELLALKVSSRCSVTFRIDAVETVTGVLLSGTGGADAGDDPEEGNRRADNRRSSRKRVSLASE
jgi:hypothetical protein